MSKPAGWIIGRWAAISASVALAGVGVVALRHALETPQPLKSVLPGEAHLYRWHRRSIFYKVAGPAQAPALVLLHRPEIGASGHEMARIMGPLAETHRVYTLDLLGFGLSDRPGIDYSAKLYTELCQDFLREVVRSPAMLVACGLSCNYAVGAAIQTPDLCTSLVLITPFALQGTQQLAEVMRFVEKPLVKALLYPLLSTRLAFLLTRHFRQESTEDFVQFYANTHQLGAEHAAMARLAGKLREKRDLPVETLQQPVLLIWGTHALENQNTVTNLHETAMRVHPSRLTRNVEIISEAALAVHIEQPEKVVEKIRRWQEETSAHVLPATDEVELPAPQITDMPPVPEPAASERLDENAQFVASSTSAGAEVTEQAAEDSAVPAEVASSEAIVYASSRRGQTGENAEDASSVPAHLSAESAPSPVPAQHTKEKTEKITARDEPQDKEPEIIAYCVKCKQKRPMLNAQRITMKNGRPAMRGVCQVCGTRLNRIG